MPKFADDTERLDWLSKLDGAALINDDFGRWAVSMMGMQQIPDGIEDHAVDLQTAFFVKAEEWHPTIREAIDAVAKNYR